MNAIRTALTAAVIAAFIAVVPAITHHAGAASGHAPAAATQQTVADGATTDGTDGTDGDTEPWGR